MRARTCNAGSRATRSTFPGTRTRSPSTLPSWIEERWSPSRTLAARSTSTAIFAAIWGKPEDLSQRSVLIDVLRRAGFDAQQLLERASADSVIAQLEAETKAAAERGVFGAPTMFVGDQMYFGNDRFDFVVEALRCAA